jgi:hypothetical protein
MPDYLPLPLVPASELATARRQLLAEAEAAHRRPLPYEIREVGESFRQLGRLAHAGEPITIERRNRFREILQTARNHHGDAPLIQLRSVQAQLFLASLVDWEKTGVESGELIELGGDFMTIAANLDWVDKKTARHPPVLLLDSDERLALFVTRWTDLADIGADGGLRLATAWPLLALRARLRLPLARLGQRDIHLVERVERLAPSYPALVSQGLLYVRIGDRARAIEAFQSHLRKQPDGPYSLRVRNHLVYAIEKMTDDAG